MARFARVERIALLSLHSSPIGALGRTDVGGMNLYVRRLADDLARRNVAVDVFTRRTDRETPEVIVRDSGARVIHLSAGPARRLPKSVLPLHLPAMATALRAHAEREGADYDLLHSHYWLSGLAAMRFRTNSAGAVPIIHMFHTLARVKEFYLGRPDPDDSALRADGERCVIGRADVVVGSTEAELNEMTRLYGRSPNRYEIIPPGVDLDVFRPLDTLESRRRLGIDAARVVLFVGRQDPMKGTDMLLRAVAALPQELRSELKVLLVGGNRPRARPDEGRYPSLVRKLGLGGIVEERGNVSQSELARYFSAADICAVPSAYESFGMVAVEAMACQTPVVAFSAGGLTTTIRQGETGFLARAGNQEDFTLQLERALTCSQLESMGRRARVSVLPYTWDRVTERTLALYEQAVEEGTPTLLRALAGG